LRIYTAVATPLGLFGKATARPFKRELSPPRIGPAKTGSAPPMSHFGILSFPGTGHLHPLTALGRELASRNHTVTIFQVAGQNSRADQSAAKEMESADEDRFKRVCFPVSPDFAVACTALESLAHGVPMIAIPVTFDQPGVGARLV
jgi:hypothetical protein